MEPQVQPPIKTFGSLRPVERGFVDTYLLDPLTQMMGDTRAARARANVLGKITGMLPGVGDAQGAAEATDAYNAGKYGEAAVGGGLTALSLIIPPARALRAPAKGLIKETLGGIMKPGDVRINSVMPTGAKPAFEGVTAGTDLQTAAMADKAFAKNAMLPVTQNYRGYANVAGGDPMETAERFIEQGRGNLNFIANAMQEAPQLGNEIVGRMSQWYDGANKIANAWSGRYGVESWRAAGALASLSPQKDWFQNVSLAQRLLDINQSQVGQTATKKMIDKAKSIPAFKDEHIGILMKARKVPYDQLSDTEKAVYVRAYDETYNPRQYRRVTPEGALGGFQQTNKGENRKVAWGSFGEIEKAINALTAPDVGTFAAGLGPNHKVRSFYNNIINPNRMFKRKGNQIPYGDVTIDTHAVAARDLLPLSQAAPQVSHNFGSTLAPTHQPAGYFGAASDKNIGTRGSYPIGAESYLRAAYDQGILPRQMQSITWEGIRSLFPDILKRSEDFTKGIDNVWRLYDEGKASLNDVRNMVIQKAGGFRRPDWVDDPTALPPTTSTYR